MERLAARIMLLAGWRRALLAIASGAVGALALPPVGFFAALFFSFSILVWLLDGVSGNPDRSWSRGLRSAFWIGWLFGFGYFVAGLWWLGNALMVEADEFAWALPLAVLGLPAVLAVFYGLACLAARLLWSEGLGRIAALAAMFGITEWLRSFVATGFPWNAIGYGAMPVPLMMQSAAVLGLFGVSALAVFVFAAPALLGTRRGAKLGLALAGVLICGHLGYGAYRLSLPEPEGRKVTVRLVQPNIDQAAKMDDTDRVAIFEKHLRLTAVPTPPDQPRPDVIVWPETTIPFILTENPDALRQIAGTLQDGQVLITGTVRSEDQGAGIAPRYYNSIYAIDSHGQILAAADKVHLVPFGEYVPWQDILSKLGITNIIDLPGGFSPGASRSLMTLPGGLKLYPLICYEVIFPDEMVKGLSGANAIINVTNDAWFGDTPGPFQHFQQARLRAVETGLPIIRAANNGISALIDGRGRVFSGLLLNAEGVENATFTLSAASETNVNHNKYNFWAVTALLLSVAVISRLGLISRVN
ncbi:apolipoprotein N-acyltransferase [Agrobacterium vitis]|uniref:apolipoprotein N-acyltransferase n=1 Tax=Agrobacterium vitis TaxID=373 RepID=UPI000872A506|nr:apolipoprotein N-acyltransferase [Agrobacterium vitis]MCE6075177.1 apolipoprotein N-acyltransferase [Agrobacterium vitis]MCF1468762.1 apolipoprotein N-acyltransferase [Agrobacterium vitis]MCM2449152.1 apolipoprotein N-acyltransferase [Agrobacterium vitis]MCM2467417.1 apolipoprotein N-acyltransferase [Agrobacterium vitis]MUO68678.1 apolipoprotein N-acyltransferase [Agrobacterium vitis]